MKFKKQIKDLSRKNPNEETCGFLVLNELMEVVVVPAVNTHKDKKKYFKIVKREKTNIFSSVW